MKELIVVNRYRNEKLEGYTKVSCMRGTVLGNPFKMQDKSMNERKRVIAEYRQWLWKEMNTVDSPVQGSLSFIANHEGNIALECCCHPLPCHCDVIKKAVEWMRKTN